MLHPLAVLAPPVLINHLLNHENGLGTAIRFEMRCQFEFGDGLFFFVSDKEAGVFGLVTKAEADGAEDCGFTGSAGAHHDIDTEYEGRAMMGVARG